MIVAILPLEIVKRTRNKLAASWNPGTGMTIQSKTLGRLELGRWPKISAGPSLFPEAQVTPLRIKLDVLNHHMDLFVGKARLTLANPGRRRRMSLRQMCFDLEHSDLDRPTIGDHFLNLVPHEISELIAAYDTNEQFDYLVLSQSGRAVIDSTRRFPVVMPLLAQCLKFGTIQFCEVADLCQSGNARRLIELWFGKPMRNPKTPALLQRISQPSQAALDDLRTIALSEDAGHTRRRFLFEARNVNWGLLSLLAHSDAWFLNQITTDCLKQFSLIDGSKSLYFARMCLDAQRAHQLLPAHRKPKQSVYGSLKQLAAWVYLVRDREEAVNSSLRVQRMTWNFPKEFVGLPRPAWLRPIYSGKELMRLGQIYKNCLRDLEHAEEFAFNAKIGRYFIFEYRDEKQKFLVTAENSDGKFKIQQCKPPCNREYDAPEIIREIIQYLAGPTAP